MSIWYIKCSFNLPDVSDRVMRGANSSNLGSKGGNNSIYIQYYELPNRVVFMLNNDTGATLNGYNMWPCNTNSTANGQWFHSDMIDSYSYGLRHYNGQSSQPISPDQKPIDITNKYIAFNYFIKF